MTLMAASLDDLITEGRALFLVIAATVLAYANSLSGAFVFDDTKQIAGNPALHTGVISFAPSRATCGVFNAGH